MDLPTNDQYYHYFLCIQVEHPISIPNHQSRKCPLLPFCQKYSSFSPDESVPYHMFYPFVHSLSSMIWFILLCIWLGSSCFSCNNFIIGTPRDARKTTSAPYTDWNGDIPISLFVLILPSHKAYFSFVCHAILFSSNNF